MKKNILIAMMLITLISAPLSSISANNGNNKDNKNKKVEVRNEIKSDVKIDKELKKDLQKVHMWGWFKKFFKENQNPISLQISNINSKESTSTAVITWKTNLASLGDIRFNTDINLVASSTRISETGTTTTSHSITLNNLQPNTVYFYTISVKDSSGNVVETKNLRLNTKKVEVVQNTEQKMLFTGTLAVGTNKANVIWVTSKPSNSKLWLSTNSSVNTTATTTMSSNDMTYFHNFELTNLATSTTYYYTVVSTDAQGAVATSTNSFKTL